MKHLVFKDVNLQKRFNENGYINIPFLNLNEIEELAIFFDGISKEFIRNQDINQLQYGSANERGLFLQQHNKICEIYERAVEETFVDYEFRQCEFMVKAGHCGELATHIHPSFVEEDKFVPIGIWVPLQDVDVQNGCVTVWPKSDKLFEFLYPRSIPFDDIGVFTSFINKKEVMKPVPLKKGEALIFNESLLHASTANQTSEIRIASVAFLHPKVANLFYFKSPPKTPSQRVAKHPVLDKKFMVEKWGDEALLGEPEYVDTKRNELTLGNLNFLIKHDRLPSGMLENATVFLNSLISK